MAFEPRGKVKNLVDAMRAAPEKAVWSAAEVAAVMDVSQGNLKNYLRAAIDHNIVFHALDEGRSRFSLQPIGAIAAPRMHIPTLSSPGDWKPPVMTPPRGATGYVPRRPLPEPLSTAAAPPSACSATVADDQAAAATEQPERQQPKERRRAAPEPDFELKEGDAPEPFNARRWLDGDIDLFGLLETDDGAHRIPAEKVPELLKLLGGAPA